MESFIYKDLNKASRDKDAMKIISFGPMAAALSFIVQHANAKRKDKLTGNFSLYRGAKFNKEDIQKYHVDAIIPLKGFTSTTIREQVAFKYAVEE